MAKIKIEKSLYERAKEAAENAGYSSVDEFIIHLIEQGIEQSGPEVSDDQVSDQLRGLGYID